MKTIVELQYANDAAFVSHTEHGLQNILDSVSESYSRMVLKINTTQKTELLLQPTGHPPLNNANPHISIELQYLKVVHHFTFLGSILRSDCLLNDARDGNK